MKHGKLLLKRFALAVGLFVLGAALAASPAAVPASAEEGIPLPIIMYHHVLKDWTRQGNYVVTLKELEQDLAYIQSRGYETVVVRDLIDYVYRGVPLPEKPIMITFDDGYLSNMIYAYPLLEKYDMKAVISVVGRFIQRYTDEPDDNVNYAQMSWEQVGWMANTGRIEIQNHSFDLHRETLGEGVLRSAQETQKENMDRIREDLLKNQQLIKAATGKWPSCVAYPFGLATEEAREVVSQLNFQASLMCYERVNLITRDPACLMELGRFNRAGGLSRAAFFKRLESGTITITR
jgi:peptidoglycan/xylan/chitin deacetylase (PgdA/CDA1 family)